MPPLGMEYWRRLDEVIQREPIEERDRFFHAMLKPLGIEKGKPFNPDAITWSISAKICLQTRIHSVRSGSSSGGSPGTSGFRSGAATAHTRSSPRTAALTIDKIPASALR